MKSIARLVARGANSICAGQDSAGVRCYLQMSLGTVSATMMPESASGGIQESTLLMLVFVNTIVMEEGR